MRFYEFQTLKLQKPLTPAQARIKSLKDQAKRAQAAVKDFAELLTTLALIKDAVAKGSLDAAIDKASGALKANFVK